MADQSKIGLLAAELMDGIEQDFGDDCEIGDVILIAEVLPSDGGSQVGIQGTNPRMHTTLGLLEVARDLVKRSSQG